ncbi:MAG: GPW/gp25 family protein [Clostridia bacterium]|nr:GPW/gp25 family protein [Clostridia bacterium]
MKLKISASDAFEIQLNATDVLTSVIQNIRIILNTWLGTVPMYRSFGISSAPLHKPVSAAEPLLMASIQEAVEKYEPRVLVKEITFEKEADAPGKIIPTVEVIIKNE